MKKLIVLLSCLITINAAPIWDSDEFWNTGYPDFFNGFTLPKADCQSIGCPSDANSCSQKKETSKDKKTIDTTIKCYSNDNVIFEDSTSAPNPDPNASINDFQYFGSFSSGSKNINIINNTDNGKSVTDDGVETFT